MDEFLSPLKNVDPPFSLTDGGGLYCSRWLSLLGAISRGGALVGARSSDLFRTDEFIMSRKARSCVTGAVLRGPGSLRRSGWDEATGKGTEGSLGLLVMFLSRIDLVRPRSPKDLGLFFLADEAPEPGVYSLSPVDDKDKSDRDGWDRTGRSSELSRYEESVKESDKSARWPMRRWVARVLQ